MARGVLWIRRRASAFARSSRALQRLQPPSAADAMGGSRGLFVAGELQRLSLRLAKDPFEPLITLLHAIGHASRHCGVPRLFRPEIDQRRYRGDGALLH